MEGELFKSTPVRFLVVLLLFMAVIALGSYAKLNFAKANFVNLNPATISVTGEGEVLAKPDIGQFSFSVRAEGDEAPAVQAESAEKVNAIQEYLEEQGVEDKDIKNLYYNLNPRYRYEERECAANSYCPPGERVQDGFEVVHSIQVKVRDVAAAGDLIAGVGERGATDISNLAFTIDDVDALKAEAREKAIADAQEKAALLAEQLGVRVVRLMGYNEYDGVQPYAATKFMAADVDEALGIGGGAPDIPTGEQSTSVQVNVMYQVE